MVRKPRTVVDGCLLGKSRGDSGDESCCNSACLHCGFNVEERDRRVKKIRTEFSNEQEGYHLDLADMK